MIWHQIFWISSLIMFFIKPLLHHRYKWLLSNLLASCMFQVWWFRKHQSSPRLGVFQTVHSMCKLYCSEKRVFYGKTFYWLQWINILGIYNNGLKYFQKEHSYFYAPVFSQDFTSSFILSYTPSIFGSWKKTHYTKIMLVGPYNCFN